MGGESIKPIRKRIHVYFLMTAYRSKGGFLNSVFILKLACINKKHHPYNEYNDLSIINNINDVLSIDQQKIYFLNSVILIG